MASQVTVEMALLLKFVSFGPLWVLRDIEMSTLPPRPFRDDETVIVVACVRGNGVNDATTRIHAVIERAPDLGILCRAFDVQFGGPHTAKRALRLLALSFLQEQLRRFAAANGVG